MFCWKDSYCIDLGPDYDFFQLAMSQYCKNVILQFCFVGPNYFSAQNVRNARKLIFVDKG